MYHFTVEILGGKPIDSSTLTILQWNVIFQGHHLIFYTGTGKITYLAIWLFVLFGNCSIQSPHWICSSNLQSGMD